MSPAATPANRRAFEIIDPLFYERHGYPHRIWAELRAHEPVSRWEPHGMPPFWAITRHGDIQRISRQPELFLNSPMLAIFPKEQFDPENFPLRAMTKMDPPEHGRYRALTAAHFAPRAVERWREPIEAIAEERLDAVAGREEVDFVTDLAAPISVFVIAQVLGIPQSDWSELLRWTYATQAATDPEFQQGSSARETVDGALRAQFEYFSRMIEDRRRSPRKDVASALAHATLDGKPLPDWELLSYVIVLMIAGNDTSRSAMSGGLLALLEHPDALARLQQDGALLPTAVEEMLRWSSPVVQFCRTPARNVDIRGVTVRAGETLCLFYPSANRDETVFEAPFEFRIDRAPNPHLAFGVGEHVCLGAHLARLELEVVFSKLIARLRSIERSGPVARLRSSFVGGLKRLPVRLRFR